MKDHTPPKKTHLAQVSKNPGNVALQKKKKQTVTDLMREWELPESYIKTGKTSLRYRDPLEKGICWYWFARFIRKRDAFDWGTCISCGKPKTFEQLQAGHFMPAGSCGLDLLFDEANVNGECEGCNGFDDTHLLKYGRNLDLRYGKGVAAILEERYGLRHQVHTKISPMQWSQMALDYKTKYETLLAQETT